jgi:topoisomerase-4 subunit B
VFIRNPHFQSQTKDRLTSLEAARFVEAAVRDHFDHYLADNMDRGRALLSAILERMDERLKRRAARGEAQTATSFVLLPGKPPRANDVEGNEPFIVEATARLIGLQARSQDPAILSRRGTLTAASAIADKIRANQKSPTPRRWAAPRTMG